MGRGKGSGGGGLFQEMLKNLAFCLTPHSSTSEPEIPSICTFPCATCGLYPISSRDPVVIHALSLSHTHTHAHAHPEPGQVSKDI